ncbi:hypothetical protein J3U18_05550 [Gilliamella sp. B3482]|uniref:hypothetical protein n=1 Tax=Gilliamella sp. B3482 TaxID=2817991 RepID=UPI00226A0179|nr:hypothetical protein [Gilliamella sp. B3482]MCX8581154.1 hypothetical protein [Gilliamella sp. B3482]
MKENKVSISARVPSWIKTILKNSAKNNDRNISLEITNRLKQTLTEEEIKNANI